jgi:hypothetical protein
MKDNEEGKTRVNVVEASLCLKNESSHFPHKNVDFIFPLLVSELYICDFVLLMESCRIYAI